MMQKDLEASKEEVAREEVDREQVVRSDGDGQGLVEAGRVEGGGGEAETGDASDPGECERAGGHLGKYFSSWSPLVSILQDGQSDVMVTAPALETLLTILDDRHYYGEHQHISSLCSLIFPNTLT